MGIASLTTLTSRAAGVCATVFRGSPGCGCNRLPSETRNGILCLETIWFDEVESPSTRHLLELLERLSRVPFVYRDVSTYEEFDFHLGRWVGRNTYKKDYVLGDYGILYLGFHGSPGEISLRDDLTHRGDDDEVDLEGIGDCLLNDAAYDCRGAVVHFGACSVLRSHARVEEFKERIGAACVSGYTRMVDSTLSWAFELMYLDQLSAKNADNPDTLRTLSRRLCDKPEYAGLAEHLGFRMIV